MYKCPNCGADIDKDAAKCPFCGYINEHGAEKQYMEKLDDVRSQLDNVDEEAAAEYGKSYKKVIKIIVIALIIAGVLAGVIAVLAYQAEKITHTAGNLSGEDMLKEMSWQRENFPKFDEMYEAGEYEKLVETIYAISEENHEIYQWQHYGFIETYMKYLDSRDIINGAQEFGWNESGAQVVTYDCFFFYFEQYKNTYYKVSEEEQANLTEAIEYMDNALREHLGYTDAEMEEVKKKVVNEYDNLNYDDVSKVAKKNMGRYK